MNNKAILLLVALAFSGCASSSYRSAKEDFLAGRGEICVGHCPFRTVIYLDESAKRDFAKFNLTPEQVLRNVTRKYWEENKINLIGYGYNNLVVKDWKHTESFVPLRKFLGFNYEFFIDKTDDFFWKEIPYITKSNRGADILVFFTGDLPLGSGRASPGKGEAGTGTIIIGTAQTEDYLSDVESMSVVFQDVDEKSLLRMQEYYDMDPLSKLTIVVMHEQGHLYRLWHVDDENSFMHYRTNKNFKLDKKSKKKLQKALDKLER